MRKILAVIMGMLLVGLLATPARTFAQPADDPASLVKSWEDALVAHDVAALSALFAEDAVVTLESGLAEPVVYDTQEEIADWLESIGTDDIQLELISGPAVKGSEVTWIERYSGGSVQDLGLDSIDVMITATVEGGQFKTFNFALTPESVEKVRPIIAGSTPPMGMPGTAPSLPDAQPTEVTPISDDGGIVGMPTTGASDSLQYLWLTALGLATALGGLLIRKLDRRVR